MPTAHKKKVTANVTNTRDYANFQAQPWFQTWKAEMERQGEEIIPALERFKPVDWVFALPDWKGSPQGFDFWDKCNCGWVRGYLLNE